MAAPPTTLSGLALCVTLASALSLPRKTPAVCDLAAFGELGPTPFAFAAGDAALDAAPIARKGSEPVAFSNVSASARDPAKLQELEDATIRYKQVRVRYKLAEARLMRAMEAFLEVPSVEPAALKAMLGKSEALVVFYAPWCPHCQSFVLHDGAGNPRDAPLEVVRREFATDAKMKGVQVVRYDINIHRDIPSPFEVQFVPSIFFASASGKLTLFQGAKPNATSLTAFVEGARHQ